MGKVEETLKSEIARLTKKQIKSTYVPLSKDVRELKRTISRLSKAVAALEKSVGFQQSQVVAKKVELHAAESEVRAARLSPRVIRNSRKRLGLAQKDMAALLGVSLGAIVAWEQGRSRPRAKNKTALVGLRKLGRRDVKRILQGKSKPGPKKAAKPKARKRTKAARAKKK